MLNKNTASSVQEAGAGYLPVLRGHQPHLDATRAPQHALTRPDGYYELRAGDTYLTVDPRKKGEPGDIVVVWPRKKGPMLVRRLARCAPYDTFHFRALDTGDVFEQQCSEVVCIHALVAGSERLAGEARS